MGAHDMFSQRVDFSGTDRNWTTDIHSVLERTDDMTHFCPYLPTEVFVKTELFWDAWVLSGRLACMSSSPGSLSSSPTRVCSYLSPGLPSSGEVFFSFSVCILRPQLLGAVRYVLIANFPSLKFNAALARGLKFVLSPGFLCGVFYHIKWWHCKNWGCCSAVCAQKLHAVTLWFHRHPMLPLLPLSMCKILNL